MAAWSGKLPIPAATESFRPLSKLAKISEEVFVFLTQAPVVAGDVDSQAIVFVTNLEVGLTLAALYFDATALPGKALAPMGEATGRAALQLLARTALPAMEAACAGQGRSGAASKAGKTAVRIARALAKALRSCHHALAATRYSSTFLAYGIAPAAGKCLSVAVAPTAVQAGAVGAMRAVAADVLVGLAGMAEGLVQHMAVAEIVKVASSLADVVRKSRGRQDELVAYTAALVHSVSAACLPVRIDGLGDCDERVLLGAARERYALAEERASKIITEIINQTVLAGEAESKEWSRVHAIVLALVRVCHNPQWAAAPLVLLCFVKGLARVVGASRGLVVTWTQREFAANILAEISGHLCREHVVVARRAASEGVAGDTAALRQWAMARYGRGSVPKVSDDVSRTWFLDYLSAGPRGGALLPPPCGEGAPNPLEATALPAEDHAHNCSFLLCAWVAQVRGTAAQRGKQRKRAPGTRRKGSGSAGGAAPPEQPSTGPAAACTWELNRWAEYARAELPKKPFSASPIAAISDDVAQAASRLHVLALYAENEGLLWHARRTALECFMESMRSSPLAHVRKQSVLGLSTACESDASLIGSRCIAEGLASRLQDDSAMVRFAAVQLVGRLPESKELGARRCVAELRAAVHSRLSDASPMVRFPAFRIACADMQSIQDAANLLRRIKDEGEQLRRHTLGAVEAMWLPPSPSKARTTHLAQLAYELDVHKDTGLRDLLRVHQVSHDEDVFSQSMRHLAVDASEQVKAQGPVQEWKPFILLLEELAAECPIAIHAHIEALCGWLVVDAKESKDMAFLAQKACHVLSKCWPSWAQVARAPSVTRIGQSIQESLSVLLEGEDLDLVRAAVVCFSVVSAKLVAGMSDLIVHFNSSFAHLRHVVEHRVALDTSAQRRVGRLAWIVASVLEHVDVDAILGGAAEDRDGRGVVEAASWLLSTLCLSGPVPMRSTLVPCIGFLVCRHASLLHSHSGPFDALRSGLAASGADVALRSRTLETLSVVLQTYQKQAEKNNAIDARGGCEPGYQTDARPKTSASEAVSRLASLQSTVLAALHEADAPHLATQALGVLHAMNVLGVLHVASALPGLLAASLAGQQAAVGVARHLLLRLAGLRPESLANHIGAGLREGASLLASRDVAPGAAGEHWRFVAVCEAYGENLDSLPLRGRFLECLLAEIGGLATIAEGTTAKEVLVRAELSFGVLGRLPFRGEAEVARVFRWTAKFLMLYSLPLLPEDGATPATLTTTTRPLGVCVASVLLFRLCQGWATLVVDAVRLLDCELAETMASDQPLPASFLRRRPMDLTSPLRELTAAATPEAQVDANELVLGVLGRTLSPDCWLLQGPGSHRLRTTRKRKATTARDVAAKCSKAHE